MDSTADETRSALARATLYSALALGFRPPTEEITARLGSNDAAAALARAAALLDPTREFGLAAALHSTPHYSLLNLAEAHRRLFGHTARGAVPPYETEYGNEALFQQPQELGDLMGFYQAFGLAVKSGGHERPDHISCECEFLSFLAMKEAYALEHSDGEMLKETRKAQKLFLKDHLGRFLPTFVQKLGGENASGFYAALAGLGLRCTQESARLKGARRSNMVLRPADDDRVPMACGSGTECAAMPGGCTPEETIPYDPTLPSATIRLDRRSGLPCPAQRVCLKGFDAHRNRIYQVSDPDDRERLFHELHYSWFVRLGLNQTIDEALQEQPIIAAQVGSCFIVCAAESNAQGADLFVAQEERPENPGRRTLRVLLTPESLLNSTSLMTLLRRELFHFADMLDADFTYEPALPKAEGSPTYDTLITNRYRVLWT
jgi:DMSO reductase family type II enzyme chaperone